ncbi:hypothetical protein F2P81_008625 [Scophthalmus maximus]|uniref:Uncharacterized protein n=1 Tax=Scophthalmus maximus TaxID=52904 RepID=A0A6A4T4T6_SCOMX|nr:hypothetical protein F2P81_008625 [Scophthalmus maximus]
MLCSNLLQAKRKHVKTQFDYSTKRQARYSKGTQDYSQKGTGPELSVEGRKETTQTQLDVRMFSLRLHYYMGI